MKKISGTKISIPHSAMLKLKQQGTLNLGMVDDVAVRIANNSGLTPNDKGTYRAMHFWSWVSVGQFLYSIYWYVVGFYTKFYSNGSYP